uniref:Uncharacterized protein n=1 Tax=Anguilla anguilla TaxID=7936 RepID=A0A0E9VGA1_ANGAN
MCSMFNVKVFNLKYFTVVYNFAIFNRGTIFWRLRNVAHIFF